MINKETLKWLLEWQETDIIRFVDYCYRLQTEKDRNWKPRNSWAANISENKFVEMYNLVGDGWLVFDWVHITLQRTGISYDYVALKNKMLLVYPDSEIDIQLVYEWDEISFGKTSWKIEYNHKISNPFWEQKDTDIIWAYTVIKNKRGEFLTTMNKDELEKHRKTAKTDYIWKQRFKEMCMKTIMKKACKLHFWDVFTKIEEQDNENYSLDNPQELEIDHKSIIDGIDNTEDLKKYREENKGIGKDFDGYVTTRKKQILDSKKGDENT